MTIKIPDNWESFSIEEITLRKSLLVAHVNSFDQNDDHFDKVQMILTFLSLRKTYFKQNYYNYNIFKQNYYNYNTLNIVCKSR